MVVPIPPGLATANCDHFAPFQCKTSLRPPFPAEGVYVPTAQQLAADVQKTPLSTLEFPAAAPSGRPRQAAG